MIKILLNWIMFLEYKKKWGFKEHSHNYYQMFLILSDSEDEYIKIQDQKFSLKKNRLLFIKKNILHEMPPIKNKVVNFIDVKFTILDKYFKKKIEKLPESLDIKNEKMIDLLYEIKKNWRNDNEYSKEIISLEMQLFFMFFLEEIYEDIKVEEGELKKLKRYIYKKSLTADDVTLKVLDYIEKNYNKEFSLNILESELHYSKEYLCRNFKKNIGWTIIYFLNYVKILEATKLLKNVDNSIENISETLNFSSSQYFSKIFKMFMGISPNEFKKSQRKESLQDQLEYGKFDYRYNKDLKG